MPKVYVLNRGAHDYSKASHFGTLVYVSDGMLAKLSTGVMFRMLQDAFKDSSPDDYILLSSLTTLCVVACSMFAVKHGKVNLLIFSGDDYISRQINFHKE